MDFGLESDKEYNSVAIESLERHVLLGYPFESESQIKEIGAWLLSVRSFEFRPSEQSPDEFNPSRLGRLR